jgi:predicted nucleic acid-binding protein
VSVLLDTSVWIRHFKQSNQRVVQLLESELVVSHEFVIAELACGSLKSREETLGYLNELVALPTVFTREVILLIESKVLYSRGIGLIDAHLLASTLITPDTQLWTADKRLQIIASELGVAYSTHER